MKQVVRIIGGMYRGKKIHFPTSEDLRPTPDRVRETLFNWLMHDITQSRCLDAFAGSGALGFEAFSRGAREVTFIEQSRKVYEQLRANCQSFNAQGLRPVHANAHQFIKTTPAQFDIIFLDPPFKKQDVLPFIKAIEQSNVLAPNGLLYLESPVAFELNTAHWSQEKSKHSGQVVYALYKKIT